MTSTLWTQAFVPDGLALGFFTWLDVGTRLSLLALVIAPAVVFIVLLAQRKFRAAGIFAMVALFVVFVLLASVRMHINVPVRQSSAGSRQSDRDLLDVHLRGVDLAQAHLGRRDDMLHALAGE